MIRLLLDEGLPWREALALKEAGWDAIHVRDVGLEGRTDSEIVETAFEARRAIVTLDSDFGELLAKSGNTAPSILFLRINGLRTPETVHVIEALPAEAVEALAAGAIGVHNGKTLRLLRSLEPNDGLSAEDWDQSWDNELTRRLDDWRSGKARSRPANESISRVRDRLAALK